MIPEEVFGYRIHVFWSMGEIKYNDDFHSIIINQV